MNKFSYNEYSSILDYDFQGLLEMDLEEVKDYFREEVKSLSKLDRFGQEMFIKKVLDFHDKGSLVRAYFSSEHRFFIDLISSLKDLDNSYFLECLNRFQPVNSYLETRKKDNLIKILEFYKNHEDDEIDKLNYIFRSSSDIYDNVVSSRFDFYFNSRIFSLFDKETLSQLYREAFTSRDFLKQLNFILNEDNYKCLYIISLMANKIKKETFHTSEFFDRLFLVEEDSLYDLLDDIYDSLVDSELEFKERFLNSDEYFELDELINMIVDISTDDYPDLREDFIKGILDLKSKYHYYVFKDSSSLDNLSSDDFREIKSDLDLRNLKRAIFYNIYGITIGEASSFVDGYGEYLDNLDRDILDSDRRILEILKAIKNVYEMEFEEEKVRSLQLLYLDNVKKKGLNKRNNYFSNYLLGALFNKMIINTYNKRLLCVDNLDKVLEIDGVKVYDAGNSFDMILSSLGGVGEFFDEDINMKSKWNTALLSDSHGLSCSHINNENLGVINFESVFLGFNHIPDYALNMMGESDIYSKGRSYDLRGDFASDYDCFDKFYPVSVLPNETRYGYNELLIDRFLMDDKDNDMKLQPSYIVYFKFNDDLTLIEKSVKMAKDFGIPIIMIDVRKIKENEQHILEEKEELLFSSDKCDRKLIFEIVTRYMNNYAGSLTMVGSNWAYGYHEDFSVEKLRCFLNKCIDKISDIDNYNLRAEWVSALMDVYLDEERKYKKSLRVTGYNYSVNRFLLDDFDWKEKVIEFKEKNQKKSFLEENDFSNDIETIIRFVNYLGESEFRVTRADYGFLIESLECEDYDTSLIENLIISYFFEDCDTMIVSSMIEDDYEEVPKFKCTDEFNFVDSVMNSSIYKSILYDRCTSSFNPLDDYSLNNLLFEIESMTNTHFLKYFGPVINQYSEATGKRFEEISCNLLDKKMNIRDNFNQLQSLLLGDKKKK